MYVRFGEWRKISVRFVNAKNDIIETKTSKSTVLEKNMFL